MKKYNIVTIERQYASGGRQIGVLVSEKLGFKFYNEEILEMAAKKLNIPVDYIKNAEETVSGSILYALAMASNPFNPSTDLQLADKLFYEESTLINKLSLHENCVIVGRCANFILKDRKDCLKIFIYANESERIKRAVEQYNVSEKDAKSTLLKNDKRRKGFYNAHTKSRWDDMSTYDMCLDSSELGIERCSDIIASAVKFNI